MKVTVVVRTYNRPEFLKEALASIKLQTHTDWEVLIFDDAASIDNFSIYNNFKDSNLDKRIVYLTTKKSHDLFQNSWLISPDLAEGEIMVRLDDDDLLVEDALEFLANTYEKNPELDFSYGLDYLGLGHTSIKKILTYVRIHNQGRISDGGRITDNTNIFNENFRIRDKVDELRPSGFLSKVIPLDAPDNLNNGVTDNIRNEFSLYKQRIFDIVNS